MADAMAWTGCAFAEVAGGRFEGLPWAAPLKLTPWPLGPVAVLAPCSVALILACCRDRCLSIADAGPEGGPALEGVEGPVGGLPALLGPEGGAVVGDATLRAAFAGKFV